MSMLKHPVAGRSAGFSLIEVLISLVILSVGLLGIAAMVSVSMKSKGSSYLRTQAMAQSSAIIDRMRANRATAITGGYNCNDIRGAVTCTAGTLTQQTCNGTTNTCTPAQIADMDMYEWTQDLQNLLGNGIATNVSYNITTVTVAQYTQVQVSISWDDTIANTAISGTTSGPTAACSVATSAPASIATATGYSNCYNSIVITSGF